MARRKRERTERIVVITGKQREDIDARAIARVLIRLARHWAEQQADDTASDHGTPGNERKDEA